MKDRYQLTDSFYENDLAQEHQRRELVIQVRNVANELADENRLKVLDLQFKYGKENRKTLQKILDVYTTDIKIELSDLLKEKKK